MSGRPTQLVLTLAALPGRYRARQGWVVADEVRGRLRLLGFDVRTQQVAAWLGRMARADMPWVERHESYGVLEYRVTRFGVTDIGNHLPHLRVDAPWIPTYRFAAEVDRHNDDAEEAPHRPPREETIT